MNVTNMTSSQAHRGADNEDRHRRTAESKVHTKPTRLEASIQSTGEPPFITLDHGTLHSDDTATKVDEDLELFTTIETKRAHLKSAPPVMQEKVDACSTKDVGSVASQLKLEDIHPEVEIDSQQVKLGAYKSIPGEEKKRTIARNRGDVASDTPAKQASVETRYDAKMNVAEGTATPSAVQALVKACTSNQTTELQTHSSYDGGQSDERQSELMDDSSIMQIVAERASLALVDVLAVQGCKDKKNTARTLTLSVLPSPQPAGDDIKDAPLPDAVANEQLTMVQPGAYLSLPGEAAHRVFSLNFSFVGASSSHLEMDSSDGSMSSIMNHQQPLAEADPVFEDTEGGTIVQANAVDINEVQKRQLQRAKLEKLYWLTFFLLILATAIIVGSVVGTFPKNAKKVVATQAPTNDISMELSEAPSSAPTEVLDLLFLDLPLSTQESILLSNTPQREAWEWLSNHQNITNLPDWRKKQLFALASFFFAFEGENWNRLIRERWMDDSKDECLWYSSGFGRFEGEEYVEWSAETDEYGQVDPCNSQGEFIWLELSDLQLSGFSPSIPPEINLLTSLSYIGLYDNDLELPFAAMFLNELFLPTNSTDGLIDNELGGLASLRGLSFNINSIPGLIPSELGILTKMESLYLGTNAFFGVICSELGAMTSLVELYISENSFSGIIPSELGQLTNLKWLDLRDLPLLTGSIPLELSLLKSLGYLDLRNSKGLSGTIPHELCYLQTASCTFVDWWGTTNNCTLEFDCTEILCGCNCPCANESLVVGGTLIGT
jgi:hypothetical protein